MTDEIWKRNEVESPCVKICVINRQAGFCIGCYRSAAEIAAWSRMDSPQRQAVLDELPGRALVAKPVRRGGRRARRGEDDTI